MPMNWKEWEGQVVGDFRLGRYLGGSERAGVFLTEFESRKAALKLIPVPRTWTEEDVQAELARLRAAVDLTHTHLLRIFLAGRTAAGDSEVLFTVMEYADEDLAQVLSDRPLSPTEVTEMLQPTLEALDYLHSHNFVHGRLKPANVMAVGDQLKLSSDRIRKLGEQSAAGRTGAQPQFEASDYDAPEIAQGQISAASDVWSLGMLLMMALKQRLPELSAGQDAAVLSAGLPAPFDEIVRNCLRQRAESRWSVAQIARRLGMKVGQGSQAISGAPREAADIAAQPNLRPAEVPAAAANAQRVPVAPRGLKPGAYVAAGVVVLLGILLLPRFFSHRSEHAETVSTAPESGTKKTTPTKSGAGHTDSARAIAGGSELSGAKSRDEGARTGELSPARETVPRRGLTNGRVAEQVLPEVPRSSLATIHGTVRVGVRLSVDASGEVTQAELDSSGPSKYFAQMALDSAERWRFHAPTMEGHSVLSNWLLRFEFTSSGTKVTPVQTDP